MALPLTYRPNKSQVYTQAWSPGRQTYPQDNFSHHASDAVHTEASGNASEAVKLNGAHPDRFPYVVLKMWLVHSWHALGTDHVQHAASELLEMMCSMEKGPKPFVSWYRKDKGTFPLQWEKGEIMKFTYQFFKIDKIIQKCFISFMNKCYICKVKTKRCTYH
jgi:hypothetical protein